MHYNFSFIITGIYTYIFFFQKKRLKLNAEGEVIEGAEDDSSQMSDMHVTVIEPATGKFEILNQSDRLSLNAWMVFFQPMNFSFRLNKQ